MDLPEIVAVIHYICSQDSLTEEAAVFLSLQPIEFIAFFSYHIDHLATAPIFEEILEKLLEIMVEEDIPLHPSSPSLSNSLSSIIDVTLPIFLKALINQPEVDLPDSSIADAGLFGLQTLAEKYEEFYDQIIPFIYRYINYPDWVYKNAAILIFGTVIETLPNPDQCLLLVSTFTPTLVTIIQETNNSRLKWNSIWSIALIFSNNLPLLMRSPSGITLSSLLDVIATQLTETNQRIQEESLDAILQFGDSQSLAPDENFHLLNLTLIEKLFHYTNRQLDSKLTMLAYDAIANLVSRVKPDQIEANSTIFQETIRRLQWAVDNSSPDLGPMCVLFDSVIPHLSPDRIQPHVNTLVNIFLTGITSPQLNSVPEAYCSLGQLSLDYPQLIQPHLAGIFEVTITQLESDPSPEQLLIIQNLCQPGCDVGPFVDRLIPPLFNILSRPLAYRKLLSNTICAIGDILLVGEVNHTIQYANPFLDHLRTIQTPDLFQSNENELENEEEDDDDDDDDDDEDENEADDEQEIPRIDVSYKNVLLESIVTSYTSVVQAVRNLPSESQRRSILSPHLDSMIHLIQHTMTTNTVTPSSPVTPSRPIRLRESLGLLGDLWPLFGESIENHIPRQVLIQFLENQSSHLESNLLDYVLNQIRRDPPQPNNEMSTDEE